MDAFALPMDADPSRDPVVAYDEFGRPVRAGRLGTRYIQGAAPVQRNSLAGTPLSLADVMATSGGARGAGQPRQTSQLAPANAPEASWGPLGGLANMLLEGFQAPGNALAGRPVTLGEVYGTAGVAALGGTAVPRPANALGANSFRAADSKLAASGANVAADAIYPYGRASIRPDDVFRGHGSPKITVLEPTKPYVVRRTGLDQVEDMVQSGMVRPKPGGYGKNGYPQIYFGESDTVGQTLFTKIGDDTVRIVGDAARLAGRDGPIPIDELRHVFAMRDGQEVDILGELLRRNQSWRSSQ